MRIFARNVAKLIPSGVTLPIVRGPLRGMKWVAGSAAGSGKGLSIIWNLSERSQIQLARQWVRPDSICFDIGANVGLYTLLFARFGQVVFSFEPLPRNLHFLYKTVEVNRLENVVIVPVAVARQLGQSRVLLASNFSLAKLAAEGSQPVVTVSCDGFCHFYRVEPDVMKIDVEGAELEVLLGAKTLLTKKRPLLLLSVHSEQLRKACLEYLHGLGYCEVTPLNAARVEEASELAIKT